MDYSRLFGLILRHKWVLLAVVTMATAGTWMGARLKGVSYQATQQVLGEFMARLKGAADMASTRSRVYDLSAALQAYVKDKGRFPRGTHRRFEAIGSG